MCFFLDFWVKFYIFNGSVIYYRKKTLDGSGNRVRAGSEGVGVRAREQPPTCWASSLSPSPPPPPPPSSLLSPSPPAGHLPPVVSHEVVGDGGLVGGAAAQRVQKPVPVKAQPHHLRVIEHKENIAQRQCMRCSKGCVCVRGFTIMLTPETEEGYDGCYDASSQPLPPLSPTPRPLRLGPPTSSPPPGSPHQCAARPPPARPA